MNTYLEILPIEIINVIFDYINYTQTTNLSQITNELFPFEKIFSMTHPKMYHDIKAVINDEKTESEKWTYLYLHFKVTSVKNMSIEEYVIFHLRSNISSNILYRSYLYKYHNSSYIKLKNMDKFSYYHIYHILTKYNLNIYLIYFYSEISTHDKLNEIIDILIDDDILRKNILENTGISEMLLFIDKGNFDKLFKFIFSIGFCEFRVVDLMIEMYNYDRFELFSWTLSYIKNKSNNEEFKFYYIQISNYIGTSMDKLKANRYFGYNIW